MWCHSMQRERNNSQYYLQIQYTPPNATGVLTEGAEGVAAPWVGQIFRAIAKFFGQKAAAKKEKKFSVY